MRDLKVVRATLDLANRHFDALPVDEQPILAGRYLSHDHEEDLKLQLKKLEDSGFRPDTQIGKAKELALKMGGLVVDCQVEIGGEAMLQDPMRRVGFVTYEVREEFDDISAIPSSSEIYLDSYGDTTEVYANHSSTAKSPLTKAVKNVLHESGLHINNSVQNSKEQQALDLVERAGKVLDVIRFELLAELID